MLFSVGYATKAENQLVQEIIALKDGINEVYFSGGKTPSGRNDQTRSEGLTPWEAQAKQIEDLKDENTKLKNKLEQLLTMVKKQN